MLQLPRCACSKTRSLLQTFHTSQRVHVTMAKEHAPDVQPDYGRHSLLAVGAGLLWLLYLLRAVELLGGRRIAAAAGTGAVLERRVCKGRRRCGAFAAGSGLQGQSKRRAQCRSIVHT